MALKRQHQTSSMFSMASMTDIIFLLLIFFMVTSTFVFPSALEVNLPQSGQQTSLKPTTRIYIDKDLNMFATRGDSISEGDLMPLSADQLAPFMQTVYEDNPQEFVALYADEEVPYGQIVDILDKGAHTGLKVVLATKPASANYNPQAAAPVENTPATETAPANTQP